MKTTTNPQPLSQVIERDLRALLAESNAITSPECLKHSIMKSRFIARFSEVLLEQHPALCATYDSCNPKRYADWAAEQHFDNAVDAIYSITA